MSIDRRGRTSSESELLDQIADIVVEFESDGRIAYVSRAVERVFGSAREALVGRSFLEILAPEDRDRSLAVYRKVLETGTELTVHFQVPRATGERVALEATLRPFARPGGEARIAAVCREVTRLASEAALEKLRSSRYRAIFEAGPDPTAIATADGAILAANRGFKALFPGAEHVDGLVAAVDLPQRTALANAWYESTRETGRDDRAIDVRLAGVEGDPVWVALCWSAFASDAGERLFAIQGHDVSRQKHVENALTRLVKGVDLDDVESLRALLRALAAALELDRITLARLPAEPEGLGESLVTWQDGDFLEVEAFAMAGLPEAIVARGEVCIHPAGVTRLMPEVADRIGRLFESFAGQPLVAEDGRVVGLLAGYARHTLPEPGRVRSLLAVAASPLARALERPGSRRVESGSRVRPSGELDRDLLHRVVQQSTDLVFVCDLETNVLFANEKAAPHLGARLSGSNSGPTLLELLGPADADRFRHEILPGLAPSRPWTGELALRGPGDDEAIPTEATIFLFSDPLEPPGLRGDRAPAAGGFAAGPVARLERGTRANRTYLAVSLRDIRVRRRAEEALRQSELRLSQARKMESVGRLAGGIAHDFNNLLTAIIGYSDLVLQELGADHTARRDIEEILRAAERAGGLTRQLLAFSRRQVLAPERVDLNAVVADIDRMLRRLIGEDVEFVTLLHGELDPILADPGQIEQVIVNLVVNARDAMPRGGRIEVETANFECAAPIRVESGVLTPGAYVVLRVSDSGTGMDEETRARIFEPFFTTKEATGGTGLGLASVYGIIHQCRGQIDVASRLGCGSTFTIYVPTAREELVESDPVQSLVVGRGRETVLVVEDSEPVRRLVERTLDRKGYTVLSAESATAALRHCSRHEGPIDLLLTDVVLPRTAGPEVARLARQLRPELRVLYMSGFTDETLGQHGLSGAECDLLEKPFSSASLLTRVRQALDRPFSEQEEDSFRVEHPIQNQKVTD